MSGVLVFGSMNMDLVVRAPRLPRAGETLAGDDFRAVPGGKGANQAVAAARLGARVAMAGRVGNDPFGEALVAGLARDGVDAAHVLRDPGAPTGVAVILVQPQGENSIVLAPGANGRVDRSDVERLETLWGGVRLALFQLEVPVDAVGCALARARRAGVRTILDPAPAVPLPHGFLSRADIVSPNETEAEALTGVRIRDLDDAGAAAERLLAAGAKTAVIKLGARGAMWATRARTTHVPGYVVKAVDTTAAGDAFTAALGVALLRGDSMEEAIRFGNAAGALACAKPGAQPSLPTAAEVVQFLAQAPAQRAG